MYILSQSLHGIEYIPDASSTFVPGLVVIRLLLIVFEALYVNEQFREPKIGRMIDFVSWLYGRVKLHFLSFCGSSLGTLFE